ncbi:primosomal protein N' [Teredinibacter turnerae]|uniref:primosomal protein N' n=1 Tax=Teredinibacter turnerae TaxID=2426 RepID=UPI0030D0C5C0
MTTTQDWFISVALPVPLRNTFDYRLPTEADPTANYMGCRVAVNFGHQAMVGIILSCHQTPTYDPAKIVAALEILDNKPLFTAELLNLCWWAADYYQHPLGETLSTAMPTPLRQGKSSAPTLAAWQLTTEGKGLPETALKRAKKQQIALQYLLHNDFLLDADARKLDINSTTMAAMQKKGLVEKVERVPEHQAPKDAADQLLRESPLALTEEQEAALSQLSFHRYTCYLLEGATGSGKTEFYLQAIARTLQAGKQALVLIPEIGLTPQTVARFEQRFACSVAELHSNVSDSQRTNNWLAARDGRARIVIGTRLASLCPLQDLGIIIVDEEHDLSFKQQDGLRYSARDLSIYRANQLQIPIVLGSATPSLESFYNAIHGRFAHLRLTRRAGAAKPPTISRVDLRGKTLTAGLCDASVAALEKTIERGQQAIVFVNRRGYAPSLLCHHCGWIAECPSCDANLTLHKAPYHLHCHHCDAQKPVNRHCPQCNSPDLNPRGLGTEQTEQWLEERFPDTPIIRIDRDSTRQKNSLQETLAVVKSGKPCILIGTQMLAKGHHFPNIALVVIADCDQGLMSADYRGPERMAQLVIQVAGRAGRGEIPGQVLIQSHSPDHPLLDLLLTKGYHLFARQLLNERQTAFLPPFTHQCLIRAESKRPQNAIDFLKMARQQLSSLMPPSQQLQYLGPIPARMERVNERFRYQLHITAGSRKALQKLLKEGIEKIDQQALARRTRWSVDVDPQEV